MNLLEAFALQPTTKQRSDYSLLLEFREIDQTLETLHNQYVDGIKEYREIELNILFLTARAKVILKKLRIL